MRIKAIPVQMLSVQTESSTQTAFLQPSAAPPPNLVKLCIIKFTLRAESVLIFAWLPDGAVLLRHGEADIHHRLQRVSGAAGRGRVDPVAL